MHLLDHAFRWIIDVILSGMALFGTSIMSVLRIDMDLFMRVFPIATTSFQIFRHFAFTLLTIMLAWGIFKNFLMPIGSEPDPPVQLVMRTVIFGFLAWYAWPITTGLISIAGTPFDMIVGAPGTPYHGLLDHHVVDWEQTHALMYLIAAKGILGGPTGAATGLLAASIVALIFIIVVGWNFLKLMMEAVERYLVVGVLMFTSPLAFVMGASKTTLPIFQSWCRMLAGQVLLLVFNVWTLRMFTTMMCEFIANPIMVGW